MYWGKSRHIPGCFLWNMPYNQEREHHWVYTIPREVTGRSAPHGGGTKLFMAPWNSNSSGGLSAPLGHPEHLLTPEVPWQAWMFPICMTVASLGGTRCSQQTATAASAPGNHVWHGAQTQRPPAEAWEHPHSTKERTLGLFFDLKGKENGGEYENMKCAPVVGSGSAFQLLKAIQAYSQSPGKSKVVYQLQQDLGQLFPRGSVTWGISYRCWKTLHQDLSIVFWHSADLQEHAVTRTMLEKPQGVSAWYSAGTHMLALPHSTLAGWWPVVIRSLQTTVDVPAEAPACTEHWTSLADCTASSIVRNYWANFLSAKNCKGKSGW